MNVSTQHIMIAFLDDLSNKLDRWAEQSQSGGWSTHQVEANRAAANDCRRMAARLRLLGETVE